MWDVQSSQQRLEQSLGCLTASSALRVFSLPSFPAVKFPPKVDVLAKQTPSPESFIHFDPSGKDLDGCRGTLSLAYVVPWGCLDHRHIRRVGQSPARRRGLLS